MKIHIDPDILPSRVILFIYMYIYIYIRARVRFMIKKGAADCRFDRRRDACIAKYTFYGGGVQF